MIHLRFDAEFAPKYMTGASSACDLVATESVVVPPQSVARIPTGVWISRVDWEKVPEGMIPELQVRARSGLAFKHGITLANGVGTIDADYLDEIGVLLLNTSTKEFLAEKGMRIAQLVMSYAVRIPNLEVGGQRKGGFGSTSL